jgi:H+/Cl- antiporter ClcA
VLVVGLMVACNVGVTKTPLGSVLVASEMGGLTLLPTTLIASIVALVLTSNVSLIDSQRQRTDAMVEESSGDGERSEGGETRH